SQTGIDAAGQRINQLQTVYASVSPTTVFVRVGERDLVQSVSANGQTTFVPAPPPGAVFDPPPMPAGPGASLWEQNQSLLFATAWAPQEARSAVRALFSVPPAEGRYRYPLREDVPRQFKSQEFSDEIEVTEDQCAEKFIVSAEELLNALMSHERVRVEKRTLEIFTREIQMELGFALPSLEQMQRKAQAELLRSGIFSAKELRAALIRRLQWMLSAKGVEDATNVERVSEYLDVLLSQHPHLLKEAQRTAMAAAAEIRAADPLPDVIDSETPLATSKFNVYKVIPPRLNSWEVDFAQHLDGDDTGTVS